MKDIKTKPATFSRAFPVRNRLSGFSLIELMIAMALFLVIGGTVVSLVRMHMPLFNTTQNQAQINISLRNAVAQLQMEAVNAGSGYTPLNPMPASPVGLTIGTKASNTCKTTGTYVAACFDSLTLISADGTVPPLTPSKDTLGTVQLDTNVNGTLYLTWPGNPAFPPAARGQALVLRATVTAKGYGTARAGWSIVAR